MYVPNFSRQGRTYAFLTSALPYVDWIHAPAAFVSGERAPRSHLLWGRGLHNISGGDSKEISQIR
jgi:hypothetical protein